MNLRQSRRPPVDINLTPLIDVVFLLLIFFMVSTTFEKETQIEVQLPEAAAEAQPPAEENVVDVVIDRDGSFYVNDSEVIDTDPASLKGAINKVAEGRTDLPVNIRADGQAPYQAVVTAMDALTQLGLTHMSFIATKTEAPD